MDFKQMDSARLEAITIKQGHWRAPEQELVAIEIYSKFCIHSEQREDEAQLENEFYRD